MARELQVRLPGRVGGWMDVDVVVGCEDDESWNRQPIVVILNEGFDGLRLAFFGANHEDVADMASELDASTAARFAECDGEDGRGFHRWDRAAEHRWVDEPDPVDELQVLGATVAAAFESTLGQDRASNLLELLLDLLDEGVELTLQENVVDVPDSTRQALRDVLRVARGAHTASQPKPLVSVLDEAMALLESIDVDEEPEEL